MTAEIVWETPASLDVNAPKTLQPEEVLLQAMREHPGEWLVWSVHASTGAGNVKAGRLRKRFPDFEFVMRTSEDRTGKVYARYAPAV